jgi:hypothetical protein
MTKTLASLVLAAPLCALAQPLAFRNSGDVAWVCGGVGSDERRALEALRPEAGLELLLVTAPRGAYVAGAQVAIAPVKGGAPVTLEAEGPTCLLKAPPGRYRIEASYNGTTRSANANVARTGKAARVVLSFPNDEKEDIRATDEEKREAAAPD